VRFLEQRGALRGTERGGRALPAIRIPEGDGGDRPPSNFLSAGCNEVLALAW
jgi:hypothetical protein